MMALSRGLFDLAEKVCIVASNGLAASAKYAPPRSWIVNIDAMESIQVHSHVTITAAPVRHCLDAWSKACTRLKYDIIVAIRLELEEA